MTVPPAFSITRFTLASSCIKGSFVCRRPAVSTSRTSTSRAVADVTASNATALGSAPRSWLDELRARPLGPDLELFAGGGAEGVRCGEADALALTHQAAGELADRRRLPRAVHPDDEHDVQAGRIEVDRTLRTEHREDLVAEEIDGIAVAAGPHTFEQISGGLWADVGLQQDLFERGPAVPVRRRAERRPHASAEPARPEAAGRPDRARKGARPGRNGCRGRRHPCG